ncbi:hypothetical protein BLNAU_21513 [Blattamonas nauphoetae]|uniref:Uncharacterized protein n=1 Tax=Blattamonas nauphoetae TaxID=2049346 RepID=A0ABQ9WVR0_9EUKA|nr:hypothetical protein BLNAU_21513 [Blattamonas nauphoetae]
MGNTVSRRLKPLPDKFEEINEADLVLRRKLQIIVDSCVGVLHRNDFLDFNRDLDDADLRDLSRFLYLSFPTDWKAPNHNDDLKPYLFRSAILSLFSHIVVNSMTYIKRNALDNPFLHVITGTPGMGKSASRFPLITLLMSFGVEAVTTKRAGECPFVFSLAEQSKADYATVTIENSDEQDIILEVPTYFYHYNVHASFNEANSQYEDIYRPANFNGSPSSYLGQIIVPIVECFPRFLHLMIGKDHIFDKTTETDYDITVTAQSRLKKGSVIAQGSTLKAGSTLSPHSSLIYRRSTTRDILKPETFHFGLFT